MHLIVYIDDILIMAETREVVQDHAIRLVSLLKDLGFVISHKKCVLDPTQELEFLGFTVNSNQPLGKVKNIRK